MSDRKSEIALKNSTDFMERLYHPLKETLDPASWKMYLKQIEANKTILALAEPDQLTFTEQTTEALRRG